MQIFGKSWFWLLCLVAVSTQAAYAQPPSPERSARLMVGRVPVADILQRLGAKLERGSKMAGRRMTMVVGPNNS